MTRQSLSSTTSQHNHRTSLSSIGSTSINTSTTSNHHRHSITGTQQSRRATAGHSNSHQHDNEHNHQKLEGIKVAIRVKPSTNDNDNNNTVPNDGWKLLSDSQSITQLPLSFTNLPLTSPTASSSSCTTPTDICSYPIYTYDSIFPPASSTPHVYSSLIQPLVSQILTNGQNGTIFAYGQTTSGKTYTMQGCGGNEEGIVQLVGRHVLGLKEAGVKRVRISYLEIYNEDVRDLLSERDNNNNSSTPSYPHNTSSSLNIREDPKTGVYVENLTSHDISTLDDLLGLLKRGGDRRVVESTKMNSRSSRSHSIFRIVVEQERQINDDNEADEDEEEVEDGKERRRRSGSNSKSRRMSHNSRPPRPTTTKGGNTTTSTNNRRLSSSSSSTMDNNNENDKENQPPQPTTPTSSSSSSSSSSTLISTINLVDLAGSESVRHTGATGRRQKEGGKINQSLLALSRVITSLSDQKQHVSFRDSKLTRILQPSLSGNAHIAVIACVTLDEKYLEETRSTLQFASRAKLIKTNPQVNITSSSKEGGEVTRLKRALMRRSVERGELMREKECIGRRVENLTKVILNDGLMIGNSRALIPYNGGTTTPTRRTKKRFSDGDYFGLRSERKRKSPRLSRGHETVMSTSSTSNVAGEIITLSNNKSFFGNDDELLPILRHHLQLPQCRTTRQGDDEEDKKRAADRLLLPLMKDIRPYIFRQALQLNTQCRGLMLQQQQPSQQHQQHCDDSLILPSSETLTNKLPPLSTLFNDITITTTSLIPSPKTTKIDQLLNENTSLKNLLSQYQNQSITTTPTQHREAIETLCREKHDALDWVEELLSENDDLQETLIQSQELLTQRDDEMKLLAIELERLRQDHGIKTSVLASKLQCAMSHTRALKEEKNETIDFMTEERLIQSQVAEEQHKSLIKTLESTIASHEKRQLVRDNALGSAKERIAMLEEELHSTKNKAQVLQDEAATVQAERNNNATIITSLRETHQQELTQLQNQNNSLQTSLTSITHDRDNLIIKLNHTRQDIESVKNGISTAKSVATREIMTLEEEIGRWENLYDEVIEERDALKMVVENMTKEKEATKQQEVETMVKKVGEIERRQEEERIKSAVDLESSQKEIDSLRVEREGLRSERDAILQRLDSLSMENTILRQQVADNEETIHKMKATKSDGEKDKEMTTKLKDELFRIEGEKQGLLFERDAMKGRMDELVHELTQLTNERDVHQKDCEDYQKECEEAQTQLNEMVVALAESMSAIEGLNVMIGEKALERTEMMQMMEYETNRQSLEMKECYDEIQESRERSRKLHEELEDCRNKHEVLKQTIDEMNESHKMVVCEKNRQSLEMKECYDEIQESRERNRKLHEELEECRNEHELLKQTIDKMNESHIMVVCEKNRQSLEMKECYDEIQESRERSRKLHEELEDCRNEHELLKQTIDKMNESHRKEMQMTIKELTLETERMAVTMDGLHHKSNDSQRESERLQKELTECHENIEALKTLTTKERAAREDETRDAIEKLTEMETTVRELTSEKDGMSVQLEELQCKFNEIQQDKEQLQNELKERNKSVEELRTTIVEERVTHDSETRKTTTEKFTVMETNVRELRSEKDDMSVLLDGLQFKFNKIQTENEQLQKDLKERNESIETFHKITTEIKTACIAETQSIIYKLTEEKDALSLEMDQLLQNLEKCQMERDVWKAKAKKGNEALEALTATIDTHRAESGDILDALRAEKERLSSQLKQRDVEFENNKKHVDELQKQRNDHSQTIDMLKTMISSHYEALQETITYHTVERNNLLIQKEHLQYELNESQKQKDEWEMLLKKCLQKINTEKQLQDKKAQKTMQKLISQNDTLTSQIADLENKLTSQNELLEQTTTTIATLNTTITEQTTQITTSQDMIQKLTRDNETLEGLINDVMIEREEQRVLKLDNDEDDEDDEEEERLMSEVNKWDEEKVVLNERLDCNVDDDMTVKNMSKELLTKNEMHTETINVGRKGKYQESIKDENKNNGSDGETMTTTTTVHRISLTTVDDGKSIEDKVVVASANTRGMIRRSRTVQESNDSSNNNNMTIVPTESDDSDETSEDNHTQQEQTQQPTSTPTKTNSQWSSEYHLLQSQKQRVDDKLYLIITENHTLREEMTALRLAMSTAHDETIQKEEDMTYRMECLTKERDELRGELERLVVKTNELTLRLEDMRMVKGGGSSGDPQCCSTVDRSLYKCSKKAKGQAGLDGITMIDLNRALAASEAATTSPRKIQGQQYQQQQETLRLLQEKNSEHEKQLEQYENTLAENERLRQELTKTTHDTTTATVALEELTTTHNTLLAESKELHLAMDILKSEKILLKNVIENFEEERKLDNTRCERLRMEKEDLMERYTRVAVELETCTREKEELDLRWQSMASSSPPESPSSSTITSASTSATLKLTSSPPFSNIPPQPTTISRKSTNTTNTADSNESSLRWEKDELIKEKHTIKAAFETKISCLTHENTHLRDQISQLSTTVKSAGDLIDDAINEKNDVEAQLEQLRTERDMLSSEKETLEEDFGNLLQKNYASLKRIENLTNEIDELEERMREMAMERDSAKDKLKNVEKDRNAIEERFMAEEMQRKKGGRWGCCAIACCR